MNTIIMDEIYSAASRVRIQDTDFQGDVFVVRNGCSVGDYICSMLQMFPMNGTVKLFTDEKAGKNREKFYPGEPAVLTDEDLNGVSESSVCFFVIDCLDGKTLENKTALTAKLEKWCSLFSAAGGKIIFSVHIPEPDAFPARIKSLAEREYTAYLKRKKERVPAEELYLSVEEIIRKWVSEKSLRAVVLRFDNILGPECSDMLQNVDINGVMKEILSSGRVTVNDGDQKRVFSLLGIQDFLLAARLSVESSRIKEGNIYNVCGTMCSLMDLKMQFYQQFSDRFRLSVPELSGGDKEYHVMDSLKLSNTGWTIMEGLGEICYRMLCYYSGREYDMLRLLEIYNGRLPMIVNEEKRILETVDRICRENNIQYFLAGGSTLGAIRHRDIIPWDDDIDIGMLRPEYEKFRKIVPGLLPEDMIYEAANGKGGSHYHFDKIRIRNTYFSTQYSKNFRIEDGIFLDVLVYDQTSNIRIFQTLQIRLASMWTRVMNVKWRNVPMKKAHRISSTLALPFLRLMSWNMTHRIFEMIIRRYEHFKRSRYVIDSVGQNIKKGAMRKEWMEKTEDVPFGSSMIPVPSGYDGYLTHLYGKRYMECLPISGRVSGHHLARLDLGDKLFNDGLTTGKTDIRGELYEKEEVC